MGTFYDTVAHLMFTAPIHKKYSKVRKKVLNTPFLKSFFGWGRGCVTKPLIVAMLVELLIAKAHTYLIGFEISLKTLFAIFFPCHKTAGLEPRTF